MKTEGKDQPWRDLMGAVVMQAYVDWARAWYTTSAMQKAFAKVEMQRCEDFLYQSSIAHVLEVSPRAILERYRAIPPSEVALSFRKRLRKFRKKHGENADMLLVLQKGRTVGDALSDYDAAQRIAAWNRRTEMNKKLRVYIAGPMTGIEDYNRLAFREAADWIAIMGLEPVHTADMPDGLEYDDYIAESVKRLESCDMIFLLPGWSASKGVVQHELPCALGCGIPATEERMQLVHIAGEMAKKKLDDEDKS